MSRSPLEATSPEADYLAGWTALGRLIRGAASWSGNERDCAFLNLDGWRSGGGSFADVSSVSGLGLGQDGRAAALVDWDFDGDQDLLVSARTGPRLRVMANRLAGDGGFLQVLLRGRQCNRDALGARVELLLEGGRRGRLVQSRRAGEGFLAQSSAWLHFGLGEAQVQDVRVHWPGGRLESFGPAQRNQRLLLVQGLGEAREWAAPSAVDLPTRPAPRPPAASPSTRLVVGVPFPVPRLEVLDMQGSSGSFLGIVPGGGRGSGRPLLLTLWSRTCAPCLSELSSLATAAPSFRQAQLDSVLLCVDPFDEGQQVQEVLAQADARGRTGFATPSSMLVLEALAGALRDSYEPLPVPCSFLIDGKGNLQVLYLGRLAPEQVLGDLGLLALERDQRRAASIPFPGRFLRASSGPDLDWLEAAMERRGLAGVAREFAVGRLDAQRVSEAELHVGFGKARLQQEDLQAALRHFQSAVESDPTSQEGWAGIGYVLHRQRRYQEAAQAYSRSLELGPDQHVVRLNLGRVLAELGDAEGLAEQLQLLMSVGSEYAQVLEQLEQRMEADQDGR